MITPTQTRTRLTLHGGNIMGKVADELSARSKIYDFSTKSGIKDQVRDYLARYTETISKVNKKGA